MFLLFFDKTAKKIKIKKIWNFDFFFLIYRWCVQTTRMAASVFLFILLKEKRKKEERKEEGSRVSSWSHENTCFSSHSLIHQGLTPHLVPISIALVALPISKPGRTAAQRTGTPDSGPASRWVQKLTGRMGFSLQGVQFLLTVVSGLSAEVSD